MLSFSAHKLSGPQGIGVLILKKKDYRLPPVKPIMYGGQQEHGLRPGTIPVALVAGCGTACELAEKEYKKNVLISTNIKKHVLDLIDRSGIDYHVNGDQSQCITSTLNLCFDGVMSEALMIATKQYCGVSNGSACTSKSYSPSYVLVAMGVPAEQIDCSIRISWGAGTDETEMLYGIEKLINTAKSMKS